MLFFFHIIKSFELTDQTFNYVIISKKALIVGTNEEVNDNALINKNVENVIIPKFVGEYTTTIIATFAFRLNNKIKSLFIPNTIQEICFDAIAHMSSLTDVKFEQGSSLTKVGRGFIYNTKVTHLIIPPTVTQIGLYGFGKGIFETITYCGISQLNEETLFDSTSPSIYLPPKELYVSRHYLFASIGKNQNLLISSYCDQTFIFTLHQSRFIHLRVYLFISIII